MKCVDAGQIVQNFSFKINKFLALMYIMVTLVNNTILYIWNLLSIDLNHSHKKVTMWIENLLTWLWQSVLECIRIPNHLVHSKYIAILFIKYTVIRLEKSKIIVIRFSSTWNESGERVISEGIHHLDGWLKYQCIRRLKHL